MTGQSAGRAARDTRRKLNVIKLSKLHLERLTCVVKTDIRFYLFSVSNLG